jgi:predicted alpha/beta superfamily hydrolase
MRLHRAKKCWLALSVLLVFLTLDDSYCGLCVALKPSPSTSQQNAASRLRLPPKAPRRPLSPPFPNGPCGGTLIVIPPEQTFDIDVNLANINVMGSLLVPRPIKIWLPPDYENDSNDAGSRGHPVLYVHDGQNAMEDAESWTGASWRLTGALTRLADHRLLDTEKLPLVVLLPSAEGDLLPGIRRRHLEYGDVNNLFAQAHADFVAETVKTLVDNRFNTNPSPDHNFLIGSSMGGMASMHLLLRHPNKFGGAACLSPAFGPAILDQASKSRDILKDKRIYLDIGGDINDIRVPTIDLLDHLTPEHWWNPGYFWLDTQLQGQVAAMRQALERNGVKYCFREYPGGRHNERAWAQRIDKPLMYLFSSFDDDDAERK